MWVFLLEPESDGIDVNPGLILLTFSNSENFVPWVDSIPFFHFQAKFILRHTSVEIHLYKEIACKIPRFLGNDLIVHLATSVIFAYFALQFPSRRDKNSDL